MTHGADESAEDPTGPTEPASGGDPPRDADAEVVDAEVVSETGGGSDAGEPDDTFPANPSGDDTGNGADAVPDDPGSVLDAAARERDEYLDALRQVQADFENYRKQALKRQSDAIEHATGRLIEELLPVFDACDAGIEHGDEGVTAIFTTLLGVLEKQGLERLDPAGEPFDPNAHEAVMHEPAADDDDTGAGPVVAEVMRPGYRWKERTLRAAMVKVRG